jgi:hypothetical protein
MHADRPNDGEWSVFLARPIGIVAAVVVGSVAGLLVVQSALWLKVLGALGLACACLILIRFGDPRPQVVIRSDGITFGGLFKSAVARDVSVSWPEVARVSEPESEIVELHSGSITFHPVWLTSFLRRIGSHAFAVDLRDGRRYKVYSPGRGISLVDVHRDVLRRWQQATGRT